jgi:hypothetical protein
MPKLRNHPQTMPENSSFRIDLGRLRKLLIPFPSQQAIAMGRSKTCSAKCQVEFIMIGTLRKIKVCRPKKAQTSVRRGNETFQK